jgi:hypothetical protein
METYLEGPSAKPIIEATLYIFGEVRPQGGLKISAEASRPFAGAISRTRARNVAIVRSPNVLGDGLGTNFT